MKSVGFVKRPRLERDAQHSGANVSTLTRIKLSLLPMWFLASKSRNFLKALRSHTVKIACRGLMPCIGGDIRTRTAHLARTVPRRSLSLIHEAWLAAISSTIADQFQ